MDGTEHLFNRDKVLLRFSSNVEDSWVVEDALKGISIIGGTGSGKTTASGKTIAHAFLKEGWGGLVLCAKTDEADLWREYCKQTGRENDLIIFGKNSKFENELIVFNPIDYESKREGEGAGETQNLTNIFMHIYRMGNRINGDGENKEERFWDTALKRCLNRVIELLKLSGEDLSYSNMVKIISSTNKLSKGQLTKYLESYDRTDIFPVELYSDSKFCYSCLLNAFIKHVFKKDHSDAMGELFDMVEGYFLDALQEMGDRTKTVVTESFMGLAEPFLYGILSTHFAGTTNIFPEWIFTKNKIIVLNFPIKEYLESGIVAQSVFKLSFQQAVERRNVKDYPAPVFLWCDEAQYFVNPYDQIFLTTARSSRTATVFLSQNLPNYLAVMGKDASAKARVDSLMGNLSTKIFHANSDAESNEYASRLIGNEIKFLAGAETSSPDLSLHKTESESISSSYLPQIQPKAFTVLKSGGSLNDNKVQAVIMVNGRQWKNGKNYIKVTFKQEFPK